MIRGFQEMSRALTGGHLHESSPRWRLTRREAKRISVALAIGLVAGAYCFLQMTATVGPRVADDFIWHWLAGRALLAGQDPYEVIHAGGQYALDAPYVYPLTTALAALPFAWMQAEWAVSFFVGVSSTLLAWGITREGYTRLPIFLSIPFYWACTAGQWSPLLAASALTPALGWLAPVKPQLGLVTIAYRPSRIAILGSIVFVAITLLVNPAWPREWISTLPHRVESLYGVPILTGPGAILLLSALRWKTPEGRLLFALSIVPQSVLFYDQLLLWLIPKSFREILVLSLLSFFAIAFASWGLPQNGGMEAAVAAYLPVMIATLYLPCLIMVLRRPNVNR